MLSRETNPKLIHQNYPYNYNQVQPNRQKGCKYNRTSVPWGIIRPAKEEIQKLSEGI